MGNYIQRIQRKENQCRMWMEKAEAEFQRNGKRYNRQMCIYLQEAAQLRSELVQLSVGIEREYHVNQLQKLVDMIKKVCRACDPDVDRDD